MREDEGGRRSEMKGWNGVRTAKDRRNKGRYNGNKQLEKTRIQLVTTGKWMKGDKITRDTRQWFGFMFVRKVTVFGAVVFLSTICTD